jgi:hypothetical protein
VVAGFLRGVLWLLGGIAVLWLVLGLAMLPAMGRMMDGGMMQGGMMGPGMMQRGMDGGMICCGGGMMGIMALQTIAMLGLVGVFIYLVIDSIRRRRT